MPAEALSPFSRRRATVVLGLAVLSLVAAFALLLSPGEVSSARSVAADGYSRSALGHLGLLRWLREQGEVVVQLRHAHGERPEFGALVVAEPVLPTMPEGGDADTEADTVRAELRAIDERIERWMEAAAGSLVVLPKRRGVVDDGKPRWVEHVELIPLDEVQRTGQGMQRWLASSWPVVRRVDAVERWERPPAWPAPDLPGPIQLFAHGSDLVPWVSCREGVLVARDGNTLLLSDPDLLANHGLLRGDNAALVLAMLRFCRGDTAGAIAFDETLHGHAREPDIWQLAGKFPYVLIPAHLLLVLGCLLWIASGRFGPVQRDADAIGAGKAFLLDNIAALLRAVGSHGPSLRRYGRQRVRRVAEALHAPRGLGDEACRHWVLARLADPERRQQLAELLERDPSQAPLAEALRAARRIRELTEEMMHVGR